MTVTEIIAEPVVHCRNVTLEYGEGAAARAVLKGVSCAAPPGARIALVGPSGSGKSSLIHVLAGLVAPSAGSVEWPALSGGRPSDRPGSVVVAFQAPSLISVLSVAENIQLPLVLAGMSTADAYARARTMLESLGLGHLGAKLPEELSGGQAQRVALGRALVTEPALLLADEPTGQVDHETAVHLLDVLFAHAEQFDMAVVVATHDQAVASRCATRWEIHNGTLQDCGVER